MPSRHNAPPSVISAYRTLAEPLIDRLDQVLDQVLRQGSSLDAADGHKGKGRRVLLLTFPNTGTSITLALGACFVERPMCTEYCETEPRMGPQSTSPRVPCTTAPNVPCGVGAGLLRHWTPREARGWNQSRSVGALIKSHGVDYGNWPAYALGVSSHKITEHVGRTFGGCGKAGGLDAVLQLRRNPFDALVARHHYKSRGPHGTFARVRAFLDDPLVAGSGTPRDLCVMLQWLHRSMMFRRDGCAASVLSYEMLYDDPGRYGAAVVSLLGGPRITHRRRRRCLKTVFARPRRNMSSLPMYLGEYDVTTLMRMVTGMERYLRLSVNLTAPWLVPCDHRAKWWPPLEPWMTRR